MNGLVRSSATIAALLLGLVVMDTAASARREPLPRPSTEDRTAAADAAIVVANHMSPGWNLGNALEAQSPGGANVSVSQETAWGNAPVTSKLMKAVYAAGFRSIRIPVAWNQYANADGQIGRAWMERVAKVVDEARDAGLYVLVNIHWDGGWLQPTYASRDAADARLKTFWTQIADRFRDYDDHLLFAGTNEVAVKDIYTAPTPENCEVQRAFNQLFVDTVRATSGGNAARYLVVQGYNTNIDHTVACNATMPHDPAIGRLMMEVHYYDPYDFTLNAGSRIWQWGTIATDRGATQNGADEAHVDAQFGKMEKEFVAKGIPVILGEYSAIRKTEFDPAQKFALYWDAYITRSARNHALVPMYWDSGYTRNHESGLFDRRTASQAYPEVISTIVDMGK